MLALSYEDCGKEEEIVKLSVLGLVALASCVAAEEPILTPFEAMEGIWFIDSPDYLCRHSLVLEDSSYQFSTLCTLDSGQTALEVDRGFFALKSTTEVEFYPKSGSCSHNFEADDSLDPFEMLYTLEDKNHLILEDSSVILFFNRFYPTEAAGEGFSVVYGCFDAEWNFTPNEVDLY